MNMEAMPVIRLEVEYMKHAILHAFANHQLQVDESLKAAVDRYCSPENIASVVERAAREAIDDAIKEEIERFFRWGRGREAVKMAVSQILDRSATPTT